jgi:hypothetical protein
MGMDLSFRRMKFSRPEGLGVIVGGLQIFKTDLYGLPKVQWSVQVIIANCIASLDIVLKRKANRIRCFECRFWRKRENSRGPGIPMFGSCQNPKVSHTYVSADAFGCTLAEIGGKNDGKAGVS